MLQGMNRDRLIRLLDTLTARELRSKAWQRMIAMARASRVLTDADFANYAV